MTVTGEELVGRLAAGRLSLRDALAGLDTLVVDVDLEVLPT